MARLSVKTAAISMLPLLWGATEASSVDFYVNDNAAASGAKVVTSFVADDAALGLGVNSSTARTISVHSAKRVFAYDTAVQQRTMPADETPSFTMQKNTVTADDLVRLTKKTEDALTFYALLQEVEWRPSIWSDEAEVVFEWISEGRHAIVSFEGDGVIGYTLLKDGKFVSGELLDPPISILPPDLREYLSAA